MKNEGNVREIILKFRLHKLNILIICRNIFYHSHFLSTLFILKNFRHSVCISWHNSSDPRRRMKDWLDPINTNAVYTNGTMRCLSITNFVDRTVSSHTAISACVINIRNVKIQDPFKLTIDAKEVNINAPFEMLGNAQLEIK